MSVRLGAILRLSVSVRARGKCEAEGEPETKCEGKDEG